MGTLPDHRPTSTSDVPPQPRLRGFLIQLLFVFVCVETGVVLFLLPWTTLWDNNYLLSVFPELTNFWLGAYFRGTVSGVGLINVWIGFSEFWHMKRYRGVAR